MALRNGPDEFGLITRTLHWLMAALILAMVPLGLTLAWMKPGLSNLWLYGLHKTVGLTLLALVILRLVWHFLSPPPGPIGPPGPARMLAKVWHWTLYLLMIAVPVSGWAGSSASGIDTVFAGTFTVPPLVEPGETAEFVWFILHEIFAKTLAGMVIVHVLAAFRRQLAGDGTVTRMVRGRV